MTMNVIKKVAWPGKDVDNKVAMLAGWSMIWSNTLNNDLATTETYKEN
jgi:hypothetical protein